MSTPALEPYPGSHYNEISPILSAVFADIQTRQLTSQTFNPQMTQLPPDDPAEAYVLRVYERMAHMVFTRWSPDGQVELLFGTGGAQFGPARIQGTMVVPGQYTALISLLAVTWITLQLDKLNLTPWSLNAIKAAYPEIVAMPAYSNVLRTFCHNVLYIAEDSFTSSTNNVGQFTDYDDQ